MGVVCREFSLGYPCWPRPCLQPPFTQPVGGGGRDSQTDSREPGVGCCYGDSASCLCCSRPLGVEAASSCPPA